MNTALTCSSNFACNGPIQMGPTSSATGVFSVAANPASAAGRRHLLQTTTVDGLNDIADAVASTVPGVPSDAMAAYHLGYYFDFNVVIRNMRPTEMTSNPAVHAALVSGLDTDIGHVGASNVIVKSVLQAAGSTDVTVVAATIDGFPTLSAATAALAAISRVAGTKTSAEFLDRALGRPRVTDPVDFYKTAPGQGVNVSISNATIFSTVGVAVTCASHDVDKYEAAISGSVSSGYVAQGLSSTSLSGARVQQVNTVQAQRAARTLRGKGGRSNPNAVGAPLVPRRPPPPKAAGTPPNKKPNKPNKGKNKGRRSVR